MRQTGLLYGALAGFLLLLAGCRTDDAPLPTLMDPDSVVQATATVVVTADVTADTESPVTETETEETDTLIEATRTPLPEVVGVPTPTPVYSEQGTFISQLSDGEMVSGTLSLRIPRHVYTLDAAAGDFINLELRRTSGNLDPLLRLYNPAGELLAVDDDSAGNLAARLRNVRLAIDGLYSIQVSGGESIGDYSLTLTGGEQSLEPDPVITPTATPEPVYNTPQPGLDATTQRLADHIPVIASISRPGDFAQYALFAEAGELIMISLAPDRDSGLRPQLEVYGPEGNLIAGAQSSDSDDGTAIVSPMAMPQAGAYILIVTGEDDSTGDYVLSYGSGVSHLDRFQGIAESNQRAAGVIDRPGIRHVWQAKLTPGDVITVAVSPATDADLDPVVELTDEQGNIFYSNDNGGNDTAALIRFAEISDPGVYLLRVRDARGDATGGYTLIWRYVNAAVTSTPPVQEMRLMTIDSSVTDDAYAFFSFQGRLGQIVRIRVEALPGSDLDPVAVLLGPDGSVLAQGDDSGESLNSDFTAILPDDGTYQVRVNGYLSDGAFELSVSQIFQ